MAGEDRDATYPRKFRRALGRDQVLVEEGATVPSTLIDPRVEPEVALTVEEDLAGPGLTPARVLARSGGLSEL